MTHYLKIHKGYIDLIADGRKPWELRKDDRNFRVGDEICLEESHEEGPWIVKRLNARITYILKNAMGFGLMDGHVILTLEVIDFWDGDKPDA